MEFVSHFNYITLGPNSIRWYEPSELNYDVNRLTYRAVLLNCISSKTIITQPNKKYSALKHMFLLAWLCSPLHWFAFPYIIRLCLTSHNFISFCFAFLCTFIAWIWKYIQGTRWSMEKVTQYVFWAGGIAKMRKISCKKET